MGESESFQWVEEYNGQIFSPVGIKRKARTKKMEFVGWGSRPLMEFLESIGVNNREKISRYDVAAIVTKYVNDKNLHDPVKKKRINCDEWLLCLFGKKTISRIKIYDLLGTHFAENQVQSDDDFIFSSGEEDNGCERQSNLSSVRKTPTKKRVLEAPKSCFAAIVPNNIKLIYLKRSLVEDLLNDSDTFEAKMVGSFVRIKSDPNDYLQKNSHMLVQVTGVKKASGTNDESVQIFLQVSNFIKDVRMSMLSNDNFSEEECKDLLQRVKDGLLKRPTIVELQEKVRVLHEDVTKHWIVGELALLQKLIDRANEKGWRKELFEYMERKQLLQTPNEQSRLLNEIPEVISEDIEVENKSKDFSDDIEQENHGSPKSTLSGASEIPVCDVAANGTSSTGMAFCKGSLGNQAVMMTSKPKDRTGSQAVIPISKPNNGTGSGATMMISKPNNGTDLVELSKFVRIDSTGSQATTMISKPKDGTGSQAAMATSEPNNGTGCNDLVKEQQKQPTEIRTDRNADIERNGEAQSTKVEVNQHSQGAVGIEVIDLSDDDEDEDPSGSIQVLDCDPGKCIWHYADPQGDIQGPFPLLSLKRWKDADYFPPDFKVWKTGQSHKEAVILSDILNRVFSSSF